MDKKPNILFYIPSLNQTWGGVRQYAAGLLQLFEDLGANYNFFIYHDGKDNVIMDFIKENKSLILVNPDNFSLSKADKLKNNFNYFSTVLKKRISSRNYTYQERSDLDKVIEKYKIDIIHCPYQFIPKIKNVKLIATLHDVQELYFPEFFSAQQRAERAVTYMDYINRGDAIIVSYNHIKQDIIRFFKKEESKVQILLLKMDNLWFKNFKKNNIVAYSSKKYLFYPANFWPHKNHKNLIEAIKYLNEKGIMVNLKLSGNNNSEEGDKIKSLVSKYKLDEQVDFLGIIDEEQLFFTYQNALGVVVPTLYEAGSFPLMESILMEIPVICANTTSLPETINNSDFVFDPKNVKDIADKINRLWSDKNYREASIQNSISNKNRLIETNAKDKLAKIYNNVLHT